jgi:hypothetical protein
MSGVTASMGEPMAKKKAGGGEKPRRYGTLIRVTDEFAQALRRASSFEKVSMAEYAATHLLPVVERRYRDAVLKEARRIEGGD